MAFVSALPKQVVADSATIAATSSFCCAAAEDGKRVLSLWAVPKVTKLPIVIRGIHNSVAKTESLLCLQLDS